MKSSFSILTLMAAAVAMAAPAPEADANPNPNAQPGYPPPYFQGQTWNNPGDCNPCFNLNCPIPGIQPNWGCSPGCDIKYNPNCQPCYDDWQLLPRLRGSCYNFPGSVGDQYVRARGGYWGNGYGNVYGLPFNN